jgi:hypothetical protein
MLIQTFVGYSVSKHCMRVGIQMMYLDDTPDHLLYLTIVPTTNVYTCSGYCEIFTFKRYITVYNYR